MVQAEGGAVVPKKPFSLWGFSAKLVTVCIPSFLLGVCGIRGKGPQQAWREKVTLCLLSLLMCGGVLFFVIGLNPILCPQDEERLPPSPSNSVVIRGKFYDIRTSELFKQRTLGAYFSGEDAQDLYDIPDPSACGKLDNEKYHFSSVRSRCLTAGGGCLSYPDELPSFLDHLDTGKPVSSTAFYTWKDVQKKGLSVFNGKVLNIRPLLKVIDELPEEVVRGSRPLSLINSARTKLDITRDVLSIPEFSGNSDARDCLAKKFHAGRLNTLSTSCVFANVFSILVSIIILAALLSRVAMAILFDWFLSGKLSKSPPHDHEHRNSKKSLYAQYADRGSEMRVAPRVSPGGDYTRDTQGQPSPPLKAHAGKAAIGNNLYVVLFVACYSEGEVSLRTTMESLATTEYADMEKLLFVVADGLVTGKGNSESTPNILTNMIKLDPRFGNNPKPYSYISIAIGSKQHNMARVYAGHFIHGGHTVPTIVVVKCGTPEDSKSPKPGNRGKRDSQIILMNFFSRVLLDDRMTPLDFDLFRKITHLMGITPDYFEIVLMVDADTRIHPMCLRYMVNAMINDQLIMGLCGETRIANKLGSWVTAIQVFEYYVSHHLGKAFESVFGGVTCLPGCFCVYRIKAKKNKEWIPILANPDMIETYSANEVETLHQRNLLLLGEDRFLTTFMIRTFPTRKMVFIPDATCKTVVPDDFKTLLSQRRRWINSTVHNLMELVLVNNLCGTFCFSMQFIVLLDLISTAVLPASILSTIYFFVRVILRKEFRTMGEILNIAILLLVIFFPILIVLFSGKRWHYLIWMFIYVIALPIWNFVLPVYAFWHFDDFSWGATRQVSGGDKDKYGHGGGDGTFDATKVSLKRWAEYERAWRKNLEKKRVMASQQHMGYPQKVIRYNIADYAGEPGHTDKLRSPGEPGPPDRFARSSGEFGPADRFTRSPNSPKQPVSLDSDHYEGGSTGSHNMYPSYRPNTKRVDYSALPNNEAGMSPQGFESAYSRQNYN